MLKQREVLLIKQEAVYNTDAVPTNTADAVLVENLQFSYTNQNMIDRPEIRPNLGTLKKIWGQTLAKITFDMEVKGPGVAYDDAPTVIAPELHVPLLIAGMNSTFVTTIGSETVTYAPISTPSSHKSATIYYYHDGVRHVMTGCRADSVSFKIDARNKVMASFSITGHTSAPSDQALPTPTLDSTNPPVAVAQSFTVGAYSAIIASLEIKIENQLAMPASINATDGFGELVITKREVSGSFDPELVTVETKNFIANWRAGTTEAIATGNIGSTQYNRFSFSLPVVYYNDVTFGDRDGIRTLGLPFGAAENTGDDEISIVFS